MVQQSPVPGQLSSWREQFLANGFLVLETGIDRALIEVIREKVSCGFDGRASCSYWDLDGQKKTTTFRPELIDKPELKILDAHVFDPDVQAAIFAPEIVSFLQHMFGSLPAAFQSLGFIRGSGQPLHDDRTFVRVDPPGNFIASWIALEDVISGNGELLYYPRSHLLPPHRFRDGSISNFEADELQNYSASLVAAAETAGLTLERFCPRKGDVLLWHSALLHGGAPIVNKGATRYSFVTHYCPRTSVPADVPVVLPQGSHVS